MRVSVRFQIGFMDTPFIKDGKKVIRRTCPGVDAEQRGLLIAAIDDARRIAASQEEPDRDLRRWLSEVGLITRLIGAHSIMTE